MSKDKDKSNSAFQKEERKLILPPSELFNFLYNNDTTWEEDAIIWTYTSKSEETMEGKPFGKESRIELQSNSYLTISDGCK